MHSDFRNVVFFVAVALLGGDFLLSLFGTVMVIRDPLDKTVLDIAVLFVMWGTWHSCPYDELLEDEHPRHANQ